MDGGGGGDRTDGLRVVDGAIPGPGESERKNSMVGGRSDSSEGPLGAKTAPGAPHDDRCERRTKEFARTRGRPESLRFRDWSGASCLGGKRQIGVRLYAHVKNLAITRAHGLGAWGLQTETIHEPRGRDHGQNLRHVVRAPEPAWRIAEHA